MGFSMYEMILYHLDHKGMETGDIIDELLEDGHFETVHKLRGVAYFDFNYDLEVVIKLIQLNNFEQVQIYIEKFKPCKAESGYIRDWLEGYLDKDTVGTCSSLEFIKSYYNLKE